MIPIDQRKALTKKDAAAVLSVSVATIDRLTKEGSLRPVQIGGVKRYAASDLDRLLTPPDVIPPPGGYDASEM